jgi:hypothetical protein
MAERSETVTQNSTADYIRGLAAQHRVTYVQTQSDLLARHMTRLADDTIEPDEIECMLFALHRAGHLDRRQLVHLQVKYLREATGFRSLLQCCRRPGYNRKNGAGTRGRP